MENPTKNLVEISKITRPSTLYESPLSTTYLSSHDSTPVFKDGQTVLKRTLLSTSPAKYSTQEFIKAGPRSKVWRKGESMVACIATCGGLCPGLNVCIYTIYNTLKNQYNAKTVYGVFDGYRGLTDEDYWMELNETNTYDKFNQPGTFLRSSRGKRDMKLIVENLVKKNVNAVFIIGGEGSHAGAQVLQQYIDKEGLDISVAAIPKTIDNDIPVIDQSFGHSTAIDIGLQAIHNAYTEAQSIECCLGLVKVMGRDTGHIAMNASLAFGKVDVVLLPEISFELYGEQGFLEYIYNLLVSRKRVLLVVAEGASKNLKDGNLENEGKDQSGNTKFGDIGIYLKKLITEYCKSKKDPRLADFTTKYIDPSYMLRSAVPNAYDRRMCLEISSDSVHGLMAGYKSFSTAIVNGESVYIPLKNICEFEREDVSWSKEGYQRLIRMTGQPSFRNKK
jgi:6-phosphofructokinase 1